MQDEERITRIEAVIEPVLRGHGVELVDLDWRGQGPRGLLRLYIDKRAGGEKWIDKAALVEALESALVSASRKSGTTATAPDNLVIRIDRKTGALRVYCRKKVVEEVLDDKLEISLEEAKRLNSAAELDD